MFETVVTANLEIHTGMMASAILSDTIPCSTLIVEEGDEDNSFRQELRSILKTTAES
jgi:hypothetical protein